ncbi:MAG: hypothetical protein ACO1TE_13490 [Prosthecobacter sp.]
MFIKRIIIVCAGLLSAQAGAPLLKAGPPPLGAEQVKDLSLAELARIIAATELRSRPLRLVMEERPVALTGGGAPAVSSVHHVLILEPGSKRERYDVIDYQSSNHEPYLISSFTDGIHSGRWERALKAEEVAPWLSGRAPLALRSSGMCYLGPDVRRSPELLLRLLGMSMCGRPLAEHLQGLREDTTNLTPDAAGDGVVVQNKFRKLTFDAQGLLKQALMFQPERGVPAVAGADGGEAPLTLVESIAVLETGRLGDITVPTRISRHMHARGVVIESIFVVSLADSSILTAEDITAATNPILAQGTIIANSPSGLGIEKARPAFEAGEAPGK